MSKESSIKHIALRLPVGLYQQVQDLAKRDRRNVHAQIVYLLERALAARRTHAPEGDNEYVEELVRAEWDSSFGTTISRADARVSEDIIDDIRPYVARGARLVEITIRMVSEVYPAGGVHAETNAPYSDADLSAIFRAGITRMHSGLDATGMEFVGGRQIIPVSDSIDVTIATVDLASEE